MALKNPIALLASLLFYAWGAPHFLVVLIGISAIDYLLSHRISNLALSAGQRRMLLTLAITLNLSLLGYFKYANFAVHEGNRLRAVLGKNPVAWQDVALPMGVSFIVFEEISYLVDVFRGTAAPARRFSDYALFLSLFPHSIAGPIFRWRDLEGQLRARVQSLDAIFDGFLRFSWGLAKKVLIANQVATIADPVFRLDPQGLPSSYAWVGLLAYTLQIYCDFSGYSDMAIGLGKMMGFSFKENFDSPYSSASITEFWRRWHISLSTWLRDYLYIPLGGNRTTPLKRYRNLILVFLLCGLWHGANWTFLAWGAYHGLWLVIERSAAWNRLAGSVPRLVRVPFTFLLVMLGWVLFRADNLEHAAGFFAALGRFRSLRSAGTWVSWGELVSHRALAFGALGLAGSFVGAAPRAEFALAWLFGEERAAAPSVRRDALRFAFGLGALSLATISLVNAKFNPFIYFRF